MNKISFYLILFLIASCGEKKKESPNVYFAGEIVNPTSTHVVLYKNDVAIDSAQLDGNNRFAFILDSISEGLHHFDHSPELQYVYLQQGDSLLIRLNTVDFDESLVFTGQGEEINNFLIEMFLANESEQELIGSYYKLDPQAFSKKLDSLRNHKMALLEEIIEEKGLTESQMNMARASIDYSTYIHKEKYPFYHKKKTGEKTIHNFPSDFYSYRKNLSFNDRDLTYFRPYYNFMKYHFGNLSYMTCAEKCDMTNHSVKNHLHFTKHTMTLIDSLVEQKQLKDNLFRNLAMDYLLKVNDTEDNNKAFIDQFHKFSGNNRHIKEITQLYEGIKRMQPQNELPNVMVQGTDGKEVSIQEIAKKGNVVFYFWWGTQKGHFRNITKKVAQLSQENPDYSFVGINLDTDKLRWLSMVETNKLDGTKQYRSDDTRELRQLLIIDHLNKAIITKDGAIADAFANLNTSFK